MSEQPEEKKYPLPVSAKFAGGTLLAVLPFDLLAHLGPTGLLVGGLASYVAWKHGPQVYDLMRDTLPFLPALEPEENAEKKQGRSFWERAFGLTPSGYEDEAASTEEGLGEDESASKPASMTRRRASDLVDLAPDVQIHKNDLAGKAIFVCGMRRHGKTTLGVRIAEQLGKYHHIPMFIPDLEGDYISAADVLPRAIIAGHSSADVQYQEYEFEALDTAETAFQLGYDLLEEGYQVILDMGSYTELDGAVMIQVNIIRGMFKWANEHPDGRVPACVYLDEAQRFLPETLTDSVIKNKKLVQALLGAYMDIIAIGGKRGINPVILTQRFAQVNKKIMAQTEVFFLMRQTHDGDLDRCMEYANAPITKEQISKFRPGQGVYIASDGTQLVTQFHQRESSGKRSLTPQADAAQRYASMPMARPAAKGRSQAPTGKASTPSVTFEQDIAQPIPEDRPTPEPAEPSIEDVFAIIRNLRAAQIPEEDIPALLGISERDYQALTALKRRNTDAPTAAAPVPMVSKEERYEQDLMTALDHWRTLTNEGKQCGFRTLRKLTGWPEKKCRDLLADLENRGYISRQKVEEEDGE